MEIRTGMIEMVVKWGKDTNIKSDRFEQNFEIMCRQQVSHYPKTVDENK